MSRRREYLKAVELNPNSIRVNIIGLRNDNPNADTVSSEVLNCAAKLFLLASKKGKTSIHDDEVFNEAV